MITMQKSLIAIALLLGLVVCNVAYCSPAEFGLPEKLGTLRDLAPVLHRTDMSSVQKTEVLLTWLCEETNKPSKETTGFGGGSITSGYIQAQIIKSLREVGDLGSMDQIIKDVKANGRVTDCVRVTLALLGDTRQLPHMKAFLHQHAEPYVRAMAAEALAALGATESVPDLKAALNDNYKVRAGRSMGSPAGGDSYPVQEAAKEALRNISNAEFLAEAGKRIEKFNERLADLKN